MSRVTTAEGVLETIYELARSVPPHEEARDVYRGYPLAVAPKGAAAIFYVVWPAVVATSAFFFLRR